MTMEDRAPERDPDSAEETATTADNESNLDTTLSNWPTDGFRVVKPDTPADSTDVIGYLALKGTFNKKVVTNTAPTAAAPQTQDNACGFVPSACLVVGGMTPASACGRCRSWRPCSCSCSWTTC